jgi:hypothetical protein
MPAAGAALVHRSLAGLGSLPPSDALGFTNLVLAELQGEQAQRLWRVRACSPST